MGSARLKPAATYGEKQIPHTARERRERVRDDTGGAGEAASVVLPFAVGNI